MPQIYYTNKDHKKKLFPGDPTQRNNRDKNVMHTDKGLRKLLEKYPYEHSDAIERDNFQSICPTSSGFYKITEAASHLTAVDLPSTMLDRKNSEMEVIRYDDRLFCREFGVNTMEEVEGILLKKLNISL